MGLLARGWEKRRFYKKVLVYRMEDGFGVQLDHRKLRTPQRKLFLVPTESLALAVAQEWEAQDSILQPSLMHLTSLCNTVLDNPQQTTSARTVDSLLKHLETDTILYRQGEPESLVAMQRKEWDPVLEWFNGRFGTDVQASLSLQPPSLPPPSFSSLSLFLCQLNHWTLEGLRYGVESCQSLILASALLEGQLDVESTADLSRLELRHQIKQWGSVEWQHDVEYHDLQSRLSAAHLLAELSKFSH
jgi:ATP synthase F1 complex assembly factor 2